MAPKKKRKFISGQLPVINFLGGDVVAARVDGGCVQGAGSSEAPQIMGTSSSQGSGYRGPPMRATGALAARRDAPPVYEPVVASRAAALEATSSASSRAETMASYVKDVRSASDTTVSNWRTWCLFHDQWFQSMVRDGECHSVPPALPLTVESLSGCVAMFKRGRYLSFGNYMSKAKDMHVAAGHG